MDLPRARAAAKVIDGDQQSRPVDVSRLVARLRFRHLQLLVELRLLGSLRAAAGVLNLTQPALSKALAEVESAFGFELFARSARGLAPTARGVVAIDGAARLLAQLAHVGMEAGGRPPMTVLRLGAPPFLAQAYLPELLAGAVRASSDVRYHLFEERVPLLVELLLDGRLDALVTSHPGGMPEAQGRGLSYEKLFDARFVVIAPADHPLAGARRLQWHRLQAQPWIMPAATSMVRRMMEEVFRREGLPAPVPLIESTNPVTNYQLVAAGIGLGAIPEATLLRLKADGRVARLRVHPPIAASPVALIHRMDADDARLSRVRTMLGLT